jgi:hypothetical protein
MLGKIPSKNSLQKICLEEKISKNVKKKILREKNILKEVAPKNKTFNLSIFENRSAQSLDKR